MPKILLDKATHTYTVNGVVKPCVSDFMRPMTDEHYEQAKKYKRIETAQARGSMVHEAINYYINFGVYPDEAYPWVSLFAQWMIDEDITIIASELMLTDGTFCGTVDLLVRNGKGELHLVDIKTTHVINVPLLEVQLAGYENLTRFNDYLVDGTYVLHLKPPKGYTYQPIAINRAKWKELYEKQPNPSDIHPQGSEEESS